MSEPTKELSPNEVSERIVRLEGEIARLAKDRADIKLLEGQLQKLAVKLDKIAKQQTDWDRLNSRRIKLIEEDQADAFSRLKNIELKLFPELASDIARLRNIIGGDDKRHNGLDYRKPDT
jgi:predicted  nucleic acid-binding Zn-ribbon protein